MWQILYKCNRDFGHATECERLVERSPYIAPPNPPKCHVCDRAMTMAKVENLDPPVYTRTRQSRTRKGVGAEQLELF